MNILKSANYAAIALCGFLLLPASVSTASAVPMPVPAHQIDVSGMDITVVRGGKGHGMKGGKMGRGGYYGSGRYGNRGRHLGWQRGRHLGWYKHGRGW